MVQSCEVMAIRTLGDSPFSYSTNQQGETQNASFNPRYNSLCPGTSSDLSLSITGRASWPSLTKLSPVGAYGFLNYRLYLHSSDSLEGGTCQYLLVLQIYIYI
jgi:hypothetical protein